MGGEGGQFQVPWCSHHRGPDLDAAGRDHSREMGNSIELDREALQRVVHSAEHTIGATLRCLKHIYTRHSKNKAGRII